MSETLYQIPASFICGDTVTWLLDLPDYPAGDGWGVTYSLLCSTALQQVTSVASGDLHSLTITAADSADYAPGVFNWQATVSNGTERHTVATGAVEVLLDYAQQTTGLDCRSFARKCLDAINATLEGAASSDQLELTIDGTTIKRMPAAQLLDKQAHFARIVWREMNPGKLCPQVGFTIGGCRG